MAGQITHSITAQKREITGRKIKNLRKEGILPANISGRDIKSITIQVPTREFMKVYSEVGETGVVSVKIDSKEVPTLIHNVHRDPVSDLPLHADFLQVNLKEKVTATVPLEFVGEAPAEKEGTGIVVQQMREIEVEALPTDLPESIEVDISSLAEVDQAVHVKDLKVDRSKVEIKEEDPERIVVSVSAPTKEEEPEPVAAEGEEGAAPAEGSEEKEGGEESDKKETSEE
jgi:large subunit ribosomal protein L25